MPDSATLKPPGGRAVLPSCCRPGLWHIGKANEPYSDLYDSLARRFGGVWLVRTNLRTVQASWEATAVRQNSCCAFGLPDCTAVQACCLVVSCPGQHKMPILIALWI